MGLSARDVVREALVPARTHRARTLFTLLGIAVAAGGLVATTSLVATGREDLRRSLDGLYARSISAQVDLDGFAQWVPDWQDRILDASGASGGTGARLQWPAQTIELSGAEQVDVVALQGEIEGVEVSGAPLELATSFGTGRVLWVGRSVATRLRVDPGDVLTADSGTWSIAGVIEASPQEPGLLLAAVVAADTAVAEFGTPGLAELEVATMPGDAPSVAARLPGEISPTEPGRVVVLVGPDASGVARDIDDRVVGAGIGITVASILVGVVFIGVTSFASVMERQPELALRRALGAKRRDVAIVILAESTGLGCVGGLVGVVIGAGVALGSSSIDGTEPIIPFWSIAAAVLCGLTMGLLGGAVPTLKAVRVDPIRFLRLL